MSSFKKLRRDCKHENGYQNKNDKCVDCGALAPPSALIEHFHQQLLSKWVAEQPGGDIAGNTLTVPTNVMLMMRIAAVETYLEKKHNAETDNQPIVSLQ